MTRRLWWMAATAVLAASGWSGVQAGCDPIQTKAEVPAAANWCDHHYPQQCCATCQPCCCPAACCAQGDAKTVTVTAPVVIFRLTGNPTFTTLPQAGGPVCPPPMACPAGCPMMGCPMSCPAVIPPVNPIPASGSEPHGYRVRVKTVEACPGEEDKVTSCPAMMVPEGARFSVCFNNEAVLGKCGRPRSADYPLCGPLYDCQAGKSGGFVQLQVSGRQDGRVQLDLDVQQTEVEKAGKEGVQVLCRCLHVVRPVTPGKTARVVLDRSPDGAPRRWLEVTIKDRSKDAGSSACSPEVLPAPKKESLTDGSFWSALGEFALEVLADCCGCECWSTETTLPSATYLNHPPQYYPPSPAFPLTRELATQEATSTALPAARMPEPLPCGPAGPVLQCNQPSAWGTAIQPCAATATACTSPTVRISAIEGESRLEVSCEGIHLACKKFDLKVADKEPMTLTAVDGQVALKGSCLRARANAVSTDQKDILVLEGRVRLHYTGDGQAAEVVADRIEVSLADGSLKIAGSRSQQTKP